MAFYPNDLFVCRKFIPVTRNEKCNCSLVSLMPFFEYNDPNTWSELVALVAHSNLTELRMYMEENRNMRIVDRHGNGPLHLAVVFKKMDVFDFLLGMGGVNINALNRYGQTCLHLAVINASEYVITTLVKRGADINISDESCCTPLHAAATRDSSRMCQLLLDSGADLNSQNLLGKTPIYHACQYGTIETICMLLYYGANITIPDGYGVLPITVAMQQSANCGDEIPQSHLDMHEVLFNYTFEKKKVNLSLTVLTIAMKINSPLFPELLKRVDVVKYCRSDLIDFSRNAIFIKPPRFKTFLRKYTYVVRDMLQYPNDLYYKIPSTKDADAMVVKLMEFLTMLFEFRRSFNFLQTSTAFGSFIPALVSLYKEQKITMKTLADAVCFLYSHGLTCELNHLITIYENCGFCELFRYLLHMDIYVTYEQPRSLMPYLICDVHMTIDKLLNYVTRPNKQYRSTLKFFSSQKLRNFFASDEEIHDQLEELPQVPSLIELSRNVARRYIIRRFRIKKTRDFYSLLKRMPINEVYKKILTYERELYPFG